VKLSLRIQEYRKSPPPPRRTFSLDTLFHQTSVAAESGPNEFNSIGWTSIKMVNKSKQANQNKYVE
jgi:hypothetical protein